MSKEEMIEYKFMDKWLPSPNPAFPISCIKSDIKVSTAQILAMMLDYKKYLEKNASS